MFFSIEEDKMISGPGHTITKTNKKNFQHTPCCHGLQTRRQHIVSLYSTTVLVVPRVISLLIQFSVKHYFSQKENYVSYNNQLYFTTDDKKLEYIQYIYKLLSRFEYFICFISFFANGKNVLQLGSIVYYVLYFVKKSQLIK